MAETSPVIEILDAVVAEINGRPWSLRFTAARMWNPTYDLADATLRVSASWGGELEVSRHHREGREEQYGIEIGVLKRIPSPANEHVDPLVRLTAELNDHFFVTDGQPQEPITPTGVKVVGLPQLVYDREALHELTIFSATITLACWVAR